MSRELVQELLVSEKWRTLTADREKLTVYAEDETFAEGLAHATEVLGDDVGAHVQRHAALVIQADCVAGRRAGAVLGFVRQHGFETVHSVRFRFDAARTAGIWQYQANISTKDSLEIADHVCGRADSVLVLLRDTTAEPKIPASLRLTDLKGRANPAKRTERHLHTVLGSPSLLVVLVHTPDEPIDVVRELSVLIGSGARELYSRMRQPIADDAGAVLAAHLDALTEESEPHDLDVAGAWDRVTGRISDPVVLAGLDEVRRGEKLLDWSSFQADLVAAQVDPLGWDSLLIASAHIEHDVEGVPRLVDRVSVGSWLDGTGVMVPGPA